jgi:arylsulfatase A-like enzyme
LWRWPGQFTPRNIENLSAHVDLLPTLTELAGADLPVKTKEALDGISLLPLLTENAETLPDRMVINHMGRWPDGEGEVEAHKYAFCSVHWNNHLLVRSHTCGRDDCRGECRIFQKVINGHTRTGYSQKADFHYAVNPDRKWALYNIHDDPAQMMDLSAKYPEIVENMSKSYEIWWKEVFPHIHRKATDPWWSQDYKSQQQ